MAIGSAPGNELLLPSDRAIFVVHADQMKASLIHAAAAGRDNLIADYDGSTHTPTWQFGLPSDIRIGFAAEFCRKLGFERYAPRVWTTELGPIRLQG
jgi:hypothetical protein